VLLPKDNEKDLAEVPPEIRSSMLVQFVETMDEVLALALERPLSVAPLPEVPDVATKFDNEAEQDQELTN
jgi:ATP-dependent Lon protease